MTSTLDRPPAAERTSFRVPPNSREAEEAVLGAILLSDQAANEVMDKLESDDFYVPAHQSIFEAIVALYNSNQPLDAVTVSEELRRRGNLEKVGGVGYLTRLVEVVPAASNIDYYATIVEEHGLRRSLIRAGATVTDLAFRTDDEIALVIDRAEQQVLSVAEKRGGQGMLEVGPLFQDVIEHIESLEANGSDVTGLATGFRDLDRKLAGLQPANLVVIAARPSMGKCLAEGTRVVDPKTGALIAVERLFEDRDLSATSHVLSLDEKRSELVTAAPSAVAFNGVKEVFRVRTRLGREVAATANHPLLTINGWRQLFELQPGEEIAIPRHIDAFGVDRRLDAEVALLGYLIGDGTVTAGTPRFTNTDQRLVEDVRKWAGQLGLEVTGTGSAYHLSKRDRISQADIARSIGISEASVCLGLKGDVRLSATTRNKVQEAALALDYSDRANPLSVLLTQVGLRHCDAGRRFVPDLVFRLPKHQLALFLNRLYATDGSAWVSSGYYRIEYSTISEQLASDVQHLLARFGIVAEKRRRPISYRGHRRPAWEVAIQDPRGVEIFATEIGIFGKEHGLNDVMAVVRGRGSRRAHSDLLPMSVWDQVLSEKGGRTWAEISEATGRPRNHNWHVRTRRLSRGLLDELGRVLQSDLLRALASSDVVWDPIVSIESAGLRRTYDLRVPIYENFVADDVIVHNSALTLNIATNAASLGKVVALFSLEMSKEEVVQRILCSVGRVDSAKLRTGQLGAQNWDRVVAAAGKMYKAPIFIDDSSVVTVTDIRAKCRRLLRARGLDLVVVDYLQLMQGSSKENRQQEIAEISRGLKNLARELSVPIIAVSQLNRSVEQREDRRPRLSDLRECLAADTEIMRSDTGQTITIGEIARLGLRDVPVWSMDDSMKLVQGVMAEAWSTGVKPVFKLTTSAGRIVRATDNHPLRTLAGWTRLGDLKVGDRIAVPRRLPEPTSATPMNEDEVVLLGHMIGAGSYLPRLPIRYTSADPANHAAVMVAANRRFGVDIKVNPLRDRSFQTRLVSPYRVTHGRRNPICSWLDGLGIYGRRSLEKRLPSAVFSLPDPQARLLLHHLWATDGSISIRSKGNRVGVYFATSSGGLARDVATMLLRVDLQPRLVLVDQGDYEPGWHLVISGGDHQRRFLTEVGCHGSRGRVIPQALAVLDARTANTNVDTIPVEVLDRVRSSMSKRGTSAVQVRRDLGAWQLQQRAPSRARLRLLADYIGDAELRALSNSDVLWDSVVSIVKDGEEEVFDALVPGTKNFIASLVCVHNSGALEQDSDVVMFIYRHEYYHPDDLEKKGLAEVNIAKHRAGATGAVEMTFLPDFTRFADIGRDLT